MITDKQLEQCGFISSTEEDPVNKNRYVTFKKGFLKVRQAHIYNYKTKSLIKSDPTVILCVPIIPIVNKDCMPIDAVWDKNVPLDHIKDMDQLIQLDKLLNDN